MGLSTLKLPSSLRRASSRRFWRLESRSSTCLPHMPREEKLVFSEVLVSAKLYLLWNLSTTLPRLTEVTLYSPVSVNVLVKETICTTRRQSVLLRRPPSKLASSNYIIHHLSSLHRGS